MADQNLADSHSARPQWRSRMGFILAAIGSAVGLGNIWRFPYMCYDNGGGAFLIPYAVALIVVGIPLMILELGIGHKMRGSAPLSLAKVNAKWEWVGWWAVMFVMYGIMLYYSTIIAYCMNYVIYSFDLTWGKNPGEFFENVFLQISKSPFEIGSIRTPIFYALFFVWFLCWGICYFGIEKGVERANKIFMPLLFSLILVLVIWCVNLEGAVNGLKVYLTPDPKYLAKPEVWTSAFSQIFFTLSLGFGIMIAYASYLPRKTSIVKDAYTICIANSLFSFISGFAVFGTLGYMASTMGKPLSEVVAGGPGLAFVTYPKAISLMAGDSGQTAMLAKGFGILFFVSLVIAGLSSAISIVEAFSSGIIDKFGFSRRAVVTFICFSGFFFSTIFTAQSGLHWVDIADHFILNYGLVLVGILECILIGWVYKASKLRSHIDKVGTLQLNKLWDGCVKYVIPAILIYLLVKLVREEVGTTYGGYPGNAVVLIGPFWLMATLIIALFITTLPWKNKMNTQD